LTEPFSRLIAAVLADEDCCRLFCHLSVLQEYNTNVDAKKEDAVVFSRTSPPLTRP
jgi:hypothetical protein